MTNYKVINDTFGNDTTPVSFPKLVEQVKTLCPDWEHEYGKTLELIEDIPGERVYEYFTGETVAIAEELTN